MGQANLSSDIPWYDLLLLCTILPGYYQCVTFGDRYPIHKHKQTELCQPANLWMTGAWFWVWRPSVSEALPPVHHSDTPLSSTLRIHTRTSKNSSSAVTLPKIRVSALDVANILNNNFDQLLCLKPSPCIYWYMMKQVYTPASFLK